MTIEQFEKKIAHLTQFQILTGAISSLNSILVDKGITGNKELQQYFLVWMQKNQLSKRQPDTKKRKRDK